MLVDPVWVSRPGENQSPTGACEWSGSISDPEGFMVTMGKLYAVPEVRHMARCAKLLVSADAQAKFEELTRALVAAQDRVASIGEEAAELRARRSDLEAAIASLTERVEKAERALAESTSASDRIAAFLAAPAAKAKAGAR
jgi:septal ring factor EnvC (AmiA/AmiB activator)